MDLDSLPQSGPRPGPHNAVLATPPRVPGSVRRTTTLDMTFPDGPGGRIVADIRGQEICTGADGNAQILGRLAVTLEIDARTSEIASVDTASEGAPLGGLTGVEVRRGFGRRLAELLPGDRARRSLAYSALEDLGGAFLVAGYAPLRAGLLTRAPDEIKQVVHSQGDVCIGWSSGGPLLETLRRDGRNPIPMGPAAPMIEVEDDPVAWHPTVPLATHTVRRRRRVDVIAPSATRAQWQAQHHFRDSYAGFEGETIMHEYLVDAAFDGDGRLVSVTVDPRVLPWNECPGAAESAQHLLGISLDDIDVRARTELVGATTCTHLTSTLRSLADVRALTEFLPPRL